MNTILNFHRYRYYPYERVLAAKEAEILLDADFVSSSDDLLEVVGGTRVKADRLTYFANVQDGSEKIETLQARLEKGSGAQKRQSTRYSVHGLHEYKGKFNPQIAKALLNICGVGPGSRVLDPFCGSGTTLVEAVHLGAFAQGYDINPFAVYLANAKLLALATPASDLYKVVEQIRERKQSGDIGADDSPRVAYLQKWFTPVVLRELEYLRTLIGNISGVSSPVFLAIASNLLRDYSLQDPKDLRIRRRKSPLPEIPFWEAFLSECEKFVGRVSASQDVLGCSIGTGEASLRDTTQSAPDDSVGFDAAVTSPPYAMALPYIDTQRLSLVWLGLEKPDNIAKLESMLVGSREIRGERRETELNLANNSAELPESEISLCRIANDTLSPTDGFRRRAVPHLLYRYFSAMRSSFRSVFFDLRPGAPYYLVVGHNHTVLGGTRMDIDTPMHLASLASSVGWEVKEMIPLQTYQRWGYHSGNAVAAETLISLRRP